nr:MAG TPA: hypothetical protein [Caudoviricetes sp.]
MRLNDSFILTNKAVLKKFKMIKIKSEFRHA